MTDAPSIDVSRLRKVYRVHKKQPGLAASIRSLFVRKHEDVVAVEDLSFTVNHGELVGFLGPNGAGKTTALKMLSGLLNPTSGSCRVLGHTPFERKYDFLRSISLVMGQKNQLWWDLPAWDSYLLNQELYQLNAADTKRRVAELADWLEVGDKLHVQVRKLSLGERMKVELIAALLHRPRVVFLDEPTIGLDVVSQRRIRQFIRDYSSDRSTTILLTSHYMADISELCRRVVVIGHGRLLYDGDLKALVARHSAEKVVRADFAPDRMPPPERLAFDGAKLDAADPPQIRLRVRREKVAAVVNKVLELEPLDLSVDDVSVDEVVEHLYRTARPSAPREENA